MRLNHASLVKIARPVWFLLIIGAFGLGAPTLGNAVPINLALNASRTGFPDPLESDTGWGGGSDQWSIVDGLRSYDSWANGLAFWYGGPLRHATINFGTELEFDSLTLWWHGVNNTPSDVSLWYWADVLSDWFPIDSFTRVYGTYYEPGSNAGYSHSDEYSFGRVAGTKVRVTFDNTATDIIGNPIEHGWLYEVEVFNNPVPEPATAVLLLVGLGGIGMRNRRGPGASSSSCRTSNNSRRSG